MVLFLLSAPSVAAAAQDESTVTAAVQVTANPAPLRAHSSPQLAVNPTNGEIVVGEADIRGDEACTVHLSVDDGRSWFLGGNPMRAPFTDCTLHAEYGPYLALEFSPSGVLYMAYVASEPDSRSKEEIPRSVFLARSVDGGRSFGEPTIVFEAPPADSDLRVNKGPMLAVDPANDERVYVGWRQGAFSTEEKLRSLVAASGDGGRSFAEPVDLTDDRGGDYPALTVDADGTVHAVYWTRTDPSLDPDEPPVRPIYYLRSTDQGQTFSERVAIDPGNQDAEAPPLIVADPETAALYVTWHANRDEMDMADDYTEDFDVFFLASYDGGRTWADRLVVNDDESGANQSSPGLAVAPDGRIDLAWYDFRSSVTGPDRGLQDVYYASSSDGGRSFGANVRVSDRSIDRDVGVWGNNIGSHHNVGIDSGRGAAYIAWQDSRNRDPAAQPEDVYMAKVNVNGMTPTAAAAAAPGWTWALAGSMATLAVAGLVLLGVVVARQPSPRTPRETSRA